MEAIFLLERKIPRVRTLYWCADQLMSQALAQMELTASQGFIMGYLNHTADPPCPRDIEEAFHLSHACVAGILGRLEKKGFLEFRPDPADKRCKRVYLLEKGRACHARMHEQIETIEARMVRDFTPEEQDLFIRLLDRAAVNLGGAPGGHPGHSIKEDPKTC